jgi:hypothetical protein
MTEKDALDKLIIDEEENPDISMLAEIISGKILLIKTGELNFEKEFFKLRDSQKILIYLLGRKAIVIKKLKEGFSEKITSKEIAESIGIPYKSVSKYLSVDLKHIIKSENGKYFVPNYNLYKCREKLR